MTAKGKGNERRNSDWRHHSGYPASMSVADSRVIDPTLLDFTLEAGVTAKGKEKERRFSNK